MLIDKVAPYWTEEDHARIQELERSIDATLDELKQLDAETGQRDTQEEIRETSDRVFSFYHQQSEIAREVEARYTNSRTKKQILADAKEIVTAYEKEDFLEHLTQQRPIVEETLKSYKRTRKLYEDRLAPDTAGNPDAERQNAQIAEYIKTSSEIYDTMMGYTKENFENCYRVLRHRLRVQYNALANDKAGEEKIDQYIAERVGLWYDKPLGGLAPSRIGDTPSLPFSYPESHLQNLTKASYKIFSRKTTLDQLQQFELDITPNNKAVTTSYSVTVDMNAPELKGTENITEYDESVFNSVVSMINANPHGYFTARQLATHLLYGDNPSNSQPSPQQIGAVTKSIEKQRHIDITIDWTDHAKLNGLPEGATYKVKGYMLPVEEHTVTMNGQEVRAYRLLKNPPLLEYASSVGQIGSHPVKMLNVPINLDEQKIVIRDYILKEILHLKNPKARWGNTITLEKIITIAGENPDTITRKKKSALLKATRSMLDYWIENRYIIKAYTENLEPNGKSVHSFTLQTL